MLVFAGADKGLSSLGVTFGKGGTLLSQLGRAQLQAAIADFTAFDGKEKNLANFLQQFPQLQNPVTEYLQSDEEGEGLENRFKNVLTGQIPDSMITTTLLGLKRLKFARRAKADLGGGTYKDAGDKLAQQLKNTLPEESLEQAPKNADEIFGNSDKALLRRAKKEQARKPEKLDAMINKADEDRLDARAPILSEMRITGGKRRYFYQYSPNQQRGRY